MINEPNIDPVIDAGEAIRILCDLGREFRYWKAKDWETNPGPSVKMIMLLMECLEVTKKLEEGR